jgi:hypothetical protein
MLESSGTKSSFLFLKSCPSSYPSDHPFFSGEGLLATHGILVIKQVEKVSWPPMGY